MKIVDIKKIKPELYEVSFSNGSQLRIYEDVIVNNAGINIPSLLVDDKEEHSKYELNENIYEKVMDV